MAKAVCVNGYRRPGGGAGGLQPAGKRRKADGGGRCTEKKSSRLSAALFGDDCEINRDQLYELLKYAALGKCHNATQPSWCRIYHQSHLAGVVVIVLHEMSQLHFYKFYLQFRHLRKVFQHRFTLIPSTNFLASLYGEGANLKPQNTAQGILFGFALSLSTTVIHFQQQVVTSHPVQSQHAAMGNLFTKENSGLNHETGYPKSFSNSAGLIVSRKCKK